MRALKIGAHIIRPGEPCFVIAEVAQNHDGSLGMAHAFIDAAADAGADAIKFQTHIAAAESTRDEPWRTRFSRQDASRYDYWKRMEFTPEQWAGLRDHAAEEGIIFLSTPFSLEAVALLDRLGVPAWKVGSGEFRSEELLGAMLASRHPILFSTGMSTWAEIDAAVGTLRRADSNFALLQCTSQYPTPLERVGLNVIDEIRHRHGCPVGLSDHSGRTAAPLAAIARGADVLEVHVTFDRRMFGPDVVASLTFEELGQVVAFRDACRVMDSHPVDKDAMALEFAEMRAIFTKSLAPARPLAAGSVLTRDALIAKKPGSGIPAALMEQLVGRRLARDVAPDRLLHPDDIEGGFDRESAI